MQTIQDMTVLPIVKGSFPEIGSEIGIIPRFYWNCLLLINYSALIAIVSVLLWRTWISIIYVGALYPPYRHTEEEDE